MAMKGMQIYKLLPKTNCKDCGSPTCLAFAMKLAAGKAEIQQCPHASDECKAKLGAATEPLIRPVKLKEGREIGNETVLFRHEKRFNNHPLLGLKVKSSQGVEKAMESARRLKRWKLERLGMELRPETLMIEDDGEGFVEVATSVKEGFPDMALILWSRKSSALAEASQGLERAVLGPVGKDKREELRDLAKERGAVLALEGSFDEICDMTQRFRDEDFKDLLIVPQGQGAKALLQGNTTARRAALTKEDRRLGFPLLNFIDTSQGSLAAAFDSSLAICKYGSVLIFQEPSTALLSSQLFLRQHIYTDPQKPIQMEEKVYEIGEVTPRSPVFVTANFSLTYYLVQSEIESSGESAYLAVLDTEGMGVLTAWAAGTFTGEKIGAFIKKSGIQEKLEQRKIVIPGYVAKISGELEDQVPDWEVIVGPQEAQDIPSFIQAKL